MKATSRQKCLQAFQKLRRLQEADENGYVTCISSGRRYKWDCVDGGHFISRSSRATEMELDNVQPQSKHDNRHLSGNHAEYRMRLIEKIGIERVERLENLLAASKGSDIAFEKLAHYDKIKVVLLMSNNEYDLRAKTLRKECRRLEKGLPI